MFKLSFASHTKKIAFHLPQSQLNVLTCVQTTYYRKDQNSRFITRINNSRCTLSSAIWYTVFSVTCVHDLTMWLLNGRCQETQAWQQHPYPHHLLSHAQRWLLMQKNGKCYFWSFNTAQKNISCRSDTHNDTLLLLYISSEILPIKSYLLMASCNCKFITISINCFLSGCPWLAYGSAPSNPPIL